MVCGCTTVWQQHRWPAKALRWCAHNNMKKYSHMIVRMPLLLEQLSESNAQKLNVAQLLQLLSAQQQQQQQWVPTNSPPPKHQERLPCQWEKYEYDLSIIIFTLPLLACCATFDGLTNLAFPPALHYHHPRRYAEPARHHACLSFSWVLACECRLLSQKGFVNWLFFYHHLLAGLPSFLVPAEQVMNKDSFIRHPLRASFFADCSTDKSLPEVTYLILV